jgi:hypothetical protein
MTIKQEMNLEDFPFWDGARYTDSMLKWTELQTIENELVAQKDEWDATELNDLFWFERDYIAEILGYEDWEALENERTEKVTYDRDDV